MKRRILAVVIALAAMISLMTPMSFALADGPYYVTYLDENDVELAKIQYNAGDNVTVLDSSALSWDISGQKLEYWERTEYIKLALDLTFTRPFMPGDEIDGIGEPGFEVIIKIIPTNSSYPTLEYRTTVGPNCTWNYEPPGGAIINAYRGSTIVCKYDASSISAFTYVRHRVDSAFSMPKSDIVLRPILEPDSVVAITAIYTTIGGVKTSAMTLQKNSTLVFGYITDPEVPPSVSELLPVNIDAYPVAPAVNDVGISVNSASRTVTVSRTATTKAGMMILEITEPISGVLNRVLLTIS